MSSSCGPPWLVSFYQELVFPFMEDTIGCVSRLLLLGWARSIIGQACTMPLSEIQPEMASRGSRHTQSVFSSITKPRNPSFQFDDCSEVG